MGAELRRIACIDDDEDILEVAKLCLEDIGGFEVTCFLSAREGVERMAEVAPDLILLDVMMPGMDGPAALAELRRKPALDGTPIVFMSARVQPLELQQYRDLGAAGVISKPFDPVQLSAEVRQIWSRSHVA